MNVLFNKHIRRAKNGKLIFLSLFFHFLPLFLEFCYSSTKILLSFFMFNSKQYLSVSYGQYIQIFFFREISKFSTLQHWDNVGFYRIFPVNNKPELCMGHILQSREDNHLFLPLNLSLHFVTYFNYLLVVWQRNVLHLDGMSSSYFLRAREIQYYCISR